MWESSMMPRIKFLQCLWMAFVWKNLVLLSPCLSQRTLDYWLHNRASLSSRWVTIEPRNFVNHELLANPWSNISQIECPSAKCLLQVNWEPTKPRSINPHSSKTSLNSCIWPWFQAAPPNFSSCLVSSLKSPPHNHGTSRLWFKVLRLSMPAQQFWTPKAKILNGFFFFKKKNFKV